MKKLLLTIGVLLIASVSCAGTFNSSWIPSEETANVSLTGYEIYCSTRTVAELEGEPHELWKSAPMDNIIDGRVHYSWADFPDREEYNCVCVAKGVSEGQVVVSDFSNEITFMLTPAPTVPPAPGTFRFEGTFQGTIVPVN